MTNNVLKNEETINSKELRNKLAHRIDVLSKVKELLTIPDTDYCTTQLVADYYEVGKEAIKAILFDHGDEVKGDGLLELSGSDTKEFFMVEFSNHKTDINTYRGGFSINNIKFSNHKNFLWNRRAILRVGMLLRDSEVAKEIRTQLLNIEEKTTEDVKIADINEEQSLALSLGMAMASGDVTAIAIATGNMMAFKNRHIQNLTAKNNELTEEIGYKNEVINAFSDEITIAEKRQIVNRVVRKGANNNYSDRYNALYREFEQKFHMNLSKRVDTYNIKNSKSKVKNKIDYIDKVLNMIPELYELCVKLFEGDVNNLINELYYVVS